MIVRILMYKRMAVFMRSVARIVQKVGVRCMNTHSEVASSSSCKNPDLMVDNLLHYLNVQRDYVILDMTFGAGGHSEAILRTHPDVKILALDRDPVAIEKAKALSCLYPGRIEPILGCFSDLPELLASCSVEVNSLDGILLDLGCSAMQLSDGSRGFNISLDGPLDMRMDGKRTPRNSITAADVLSKLDEHDLHRILKIYGGLEQSKKLAQVLVACRYRLRSLQTTFELRDLLTEVLHKHNLGTIKKVVQALRVFVNNEFNELNYGMLMALTFLKESRHLVVLTHNPEEDLIVKRHLTGNVIENNPNPVPLSMFSRTHSLSPEEIQDLRNSPWSSLSKHAIQLSFREKQENPHAKSTKLRAAVKL